MRPTESEILDMLTSQADLPEPLRIISVQEQPRMAGSWRPDALLRMQLPDGPQFDAVLEITTLGTPKAVQEKSVILQPLARKGGSVPLLAAPYLPQRQQDMLNSQGISWIDLSGNMRINVPGQVYIERTGKPNRFKQSAPIKRIFQGRSALVSRALLLQPEGFENLYAIVDFINSRNGSITIGTVSKVIRRLEEDLLVRRDKAGIRAIDRSQLLDELADGYNKSAKTSIDTFRYRAEDVRTFIRRMIERKDLDYAAAGFYAAQLKGLATTDKYTLWIRSITEVKKAMSLAGKPAEPDSEFGNVELKETEEPGVWFNVQGNPFQRIVDDLQLYLEMYASKGRGRTIAEQLRPRILGEE